MIKTSTTIINKLGLHARASAKLTKLAGSFVCEVWMIRGDHQVILAGAAIPFGGESDWAQDFPSRRVGHGQRQTAIGMPAGEGVHPVARLPPRHHVAGLVRHRIAFQFQGDAPDGIGDIPFTSGPR